MTETFEQGGRRIYEERIAGMVAAKLYSESQPNASPDFWRGFALFMDRFSQAIPPASPSARPGSDAPAERSSHTPT